MIEIYLISGFLGAGKTTLIQKMLAESFSDKKVALIENDFGKVSFDAALLQSSGVEVTEINSGCICCTLFGDFVQAIITLQESMAPDVIIIEPSGVGKLSDIIRACEQPQILEFAQIKAKIAVVDIKRYQMYLDNFSEFYEDQIINADTIVLSRTDQYPEKINDVFDVIAKINPHAFLFSRPWEQIAVKDILESAGDKITKTVSEITNNQNDTSHQQENNMHDHHHGADEIFESITIKPKVVLSEQELVKRFTLLAKNCQGQILRAKGILPSPNGYLILQYLPGEIKITKSQIEDNSLTIIGSHLDRRELLAAFYQ